MLEAMGQNIHLVGPTGAGATIKLINQMMNSVNAPVGAEGLILATKAGIDPRARPRDPADQQRRQPRRSTPGAVGVRAQLRARLCTST